MSESVVMMGNNATCPMRVKEQLEFECKMKSSEPLWNVKHVPELYRSHISLSSLE